MGEGEKERGREGGVDCYSMAFTFICSTTPWPGSTLETGIWVPRDKVALIAETKVQEQPQSLQKQEHELFSVRQ